MADVEDSTHSIAKLLIEIQDELMHARFRLDPLELIFEGLEDTRAASACQEVFDLASEKLGSVQDKFDALARRLLEKKEPA